MEPEKQVRLRYVEDQLIAGITRKAIEYEIIAKWGFRASTARQYISDAKAILSARLDESDRNAVIAGLYNQLDSIRKSPKTSVRDKLLAIRQIAVMRGFNAPKQYQINSDLKQIVFNDDKELADVADGFGTPNTQELPNPTAPEGI